MAAFNAGDIDALGDIYVDDVVFTPGNLPFGPAGQPITNAYSGKVEAINEHLQSIAANAKITVSNISVAGNTLRGGFSYTDDSPGLGNIGPLTGAWETVVEAGRITSVKMTIDEGAYEKWKTAVALASTPPPPITFSEGGTTQAVINQLPADEVECIRQGLGEAAFGQFMLRGFEEDTSAAEDKVLYRCVSNQSLSRLLMGFAVIEFGGLSDATIACMGKALSTHDLKAIFFGETAWGEAFQAMAGCISDDERARAEASGSFGDEAPEVERRVGKPGLIDMGGRQLYLICEGEGSPTVVMEAGGRGNSGSWRLVQPFVAGFTHVCAYDRAGTGFSESVPPHDTAQAIADDLHTLLANAGIDGPYVLVGHSLGGHLVRAFANRYLGEVVGMVLVDTGHGDPRARFQAVLTPEEWQLVRDVILHRDEGFTLPEGLDLMGPDLGEIPLVVLTAGRVSGGVLPPDIAERLDQVRLETQKELLTLSSNSTHIIAEESGHAIQKDQPDAGHVPSSGVRVRHPVDVV